MNEIVKQTNDAVVVNELTGEIKQNFNRNLGDKPIRISIKVQKKTNSKTGKQFNDVSGLKNIDVYGNEDSKESGKYLGRKNRWLRMHFTQDAFKNDKNTDCNISDINDLSTGFLYVKAKYIQSPKKYQVVFDKNEKGELLYNKDGKAKMIYPEIWIKGGILGFEPYVSDQDEFDYHQPDLDAEFEEVEKIEDVESEEDDTEESMM